MGNGDNDDDDDNNDLNNETVTNIINNCKYYDIDELKILKSNYKHKYTAIHINIHSLPSKYDELISLIAEINTIGIEINFIMLCETFLTDTNQSMFEIPGYQFLQKNRSNRKGGGVCVYAMNKFQCIPREDLSVNYTNEFESIFIEITNLAHKLIVGEVYRVPGTNELNSIARYDDILNKLDTFKGDVIIGTDQNFNYINTDSHTNTLNLLNTFVAAGFLPTITKPTRITHNTSTLIDNIYVKVNKIETLKSGIISTYISDHLPIFMFNGKLTPTQHKSTTIIYRSINDKAINNIRQQLDSINWHSLYNTHINDSVTKLNSEIKNALDLHAPEKTKLISNKNKLKQPWMTTELLKSTKTRDKLYSKCISKPRDSPAYIKFLEHRNSHNRQKRITKQNYYTGLLQDYKHDSRKTWSILNSLTGRNKKKTSISDSFLTDNNIPITDQAQISNNFCKYFTEVGHKLASKIPKPVKPFEKHLINKNNLSMFLYPTDPEEINKTLSALKPKTSTGHDNINSKLIKTLSASIATPLSVIINKSLESGIVPNTWKLAKIIPIYKSKEKK